MTALSEPTTKGILDSFNETRLRTLELVQTLERDDFVVQTAYYMSPPKWHLGHVSWLYEVILSKLNTDYEFYSKEFSEYLNSYYHQFGEPHDKGKRGIMSRPTVDEVFEYFEKVNQRVTGFLENNSVSNKANQLLTMGMHHECQHQELLVYDLQHLLADEYRPVKKNSPPTAQNVDPKSIAISGGLYALGFHGEGFCYDIELPEHKVFLNDYRIDAYPVTNGQYISFIEDGGYNDFRYWLSDGWDAVKKNNWQAPMYWEKENDRWIVRDFLGKRRINPKQPVCHVSFYEADAYCRWAGKRLPSEAEWEKAACWNEGKMRKTIFPWGNDVPNENNANLLESYLWNTSEIGSYPEGISSYGCHQMIGDVWEWTSSEYVGYPGFKTGFSEYNDKWFTNQKVLRGGSFGTPKMSIRGSYRNFFRLDERWLFSGFRCAEDA